MAQLSPKELNKLIKERAAKERLMARQRRLVRFIHWRRTKGLEFKNELRKVIKRCHALEVEVLPVIQNFVVQDVMDS